MQVAIGCDHRGFGVKGKIIECLMLAARFYRLRHQLQRKRRLSRHRAKSSAS